MNSKRDWQPWGAPNKKENALQICPARAKGDAGYSGSEFRGCLAPFLIAPSPRRAAAPRRPPKNGGQSGCKRRRPGRDVTTDFQNEHDDPAAHLRIPSRPAPAP